LIDNWPVIGIDKNGDGKGEPALTYKKPNVGKMYSIVTPVESDEFNSNNLGLQWQWMANPQPTWYFTDPAKGVLRLFSSKEPGSARNLWDVPNVLLQKFPAEEFMVTTKLSFYPNSKLENEETGLTIMGLSYACIKLVKKHDGTYLVYAVCDNAEKGETEKENEIKKIDDNTIYLRVTINKGGISNFSYSTDGSNFVNAGDTFRAKEGKWIGAKVGIFCTRKDQTNDSGYTDFDWFRVEK